MYEKELSTYFEAHTEDFLCDLARLIAIPSIKSDKSHGCPFGPAPANALKAALSMASEYGLHIENWDNYIGIVETGPAHRFLDILTHLDVVPAGDGWTITEPFRMKVVDGVIYGRGSCDDKGPALAALYALRAIHDLHIPLFRGVRLVFGSDEESGSADLAYYFRKTSPAAMTFSPDAVYPVITVEKGRLEGHLSSSFTCPQLLSIQAGHTINMIPDSASAVLQGVDITAVKAAIDCYKEPYKVDIIPLTNDKYRLLVHGISGHAASPEDAANPVTALLRLLSECLDCKEIRNLSLLFPFGKYHGEGLGIDMEDTRSGRLTLSLTQLHYDGSFLTAAFDSRVPVCGTAERLDSAKRAVEHAGFFYTASVSLPHSVPEDTPFIHGLLDSYASASGKPGKTLAIGGGTYAHGIDNAVAFGCMTEGFSNHMHGADECAELSTLLMSCRIFAESIIRLCGMPSMLLPASPPKAGLLWLCQPDSRSARHLFHTFVQHGIAVMPVLCDKRTPPMDELMRIKSILPVLYSVREDISVPLYAIGVDCGSALAAQLCDDYYIHSLSLPDDICQASSVILNQIL